MNNKFKVKINDSEHELWAENPASLSDTNNLENLTRCLHVSYIWL